MEPNLVYSNVLLFVLLLGSTSLILAATPKLNTQEVKALKEIGNKIGKKDWDFGVDPCSGKGNWNESDNRKGFESSVICDCSFNHNSSCHVVSISLKAQNLSGTLSPEFSKLLYLKQLDLSRNVITGAIPQQWATMSLVELSFMGNRLSGPFPKVLTNITTLKNLSIEGNQFSGFIPTEIGKLINLEKLILSSNGFTGALPSALSKLTKLTDLRISDNNFYGKIPDFISKWALIQKLQIQGCSLEGPIPSSISALTRLSDLRITDLKGSRSSAFPPLNNMKSMKTLILRKCLIKGEIPEYIGTMEKLKILDLSFNSLSGKIPESFAQLDKVDFMYLTGNMLSGTIPGWVLGNNRIVDVSYNNFTWDSSSPTECQHGSVNLVEGYSSSVDTRSKIHPCLKRNFPCPSTVSKYAHTLYINCGGNEANINGQIYEADGERKGASMLYYTRQDWALSSTGNFMDNDIDSDPYIVANTSRLLNVSVPYSKLYTKARVSPLALTYYGLCLMPGSYTVKLHFAEIVFANDRSFTSLGRRVFDVYIQGKLVLKDFDIQKEAGGAGKPIVKTFNANVTERTLKIHFYWAGKGTTGIPTRGVYGPLVSAISVHSNFNPPSELPIRTIILAAGIVTGVLVVFLMVVVSMRRRGWLGGKDPVYKELRGIDLQTGLFTLKQIKAATKNFDAENKIGEGGFGSVYKGLLSDGTVIAVKQLSSKSRQGNREFVNEIGMISGLQHPNLVKLYGCCVEANQLILIYEYMENNCLSRILFGKGADSKTKLDWPTRKKICLGIARALAYLHEESRIKIIHRDIKTSNVLLDKGFNAKVSDFGLAKLIEDDKTHVSTKGFSSCLVVAMASNTGSHSRNGLRFSHCDSDEENGDYNQKQKWQHNDQAFSLSGSDASKDFEEEKAFNNNEEKRKEKQEKRGSLNLMSNDQGDAYLLDEARQPLWRKVPIASSLINPYRIVIVTRLVVLVFFFHFRISTPVNDAFALWIISVICEIWLALSWLVDQLPKWFPITRVTSLDRLSLRFEHQQGEPNLLAPVDVFVTTADPLKEPPIVTANTVLSILSVDYPVGKVSCYVSDDSASMLIFDTLAETAEFARIWVPFCNMYSIEPRAPESYFYQKVDYLKDKVHPTFVKDRRAMKREYEEFKLKINVLVAKAQKKPEEGWVLQDGTPWPGNDTDNHPGMIQVCLGNAGALDNEGKELPRLVYISREKRPGYQHHRKAGAMNALLRVSAVLSNAPFVLNLDCDQYINNSKALREAMCFLMDSQFGKKICYVQFPRRFDGIDSNDRYANHNTVFFDINMKCLDGIQGPVYVGTGCVFNRQALYGYKPPSEKKSKTCWPSCCCCCFGDSQSTFEEEIDEGLGDCDEHEESSFMSLKVCEKRFGQSPVFIASALMEDGGLPKGTNTRLLIKEAIHVISCGYEEKTEWGKEIGWLYGSVTEDILTGFNMHCRGWKSVYCMPKRAAFKGSAPINLSDRLHQVLKWALGSTEIFFSGYCPLWYGYSGKLKWLQRLAYINTIVYPFTSIPLLVYCTIPAICLLTGKFIIPTLTNLAGIWLMALFITIILTCVLELRWSKVSIHDWWRNEQFWIIGGVSAHLFAVFQGLLRVAGLGTNFTVRAKSTDDTVLGQLHLFKWTTLLIPPTSLVILNMVGIVAGLSDALNNGYESWGPLFGKLFFSFWVIVHLYPFLKGLMGRQNRTPTIVVLWSTLLALIFSMIWVRIDIFLPKQTGPVLKQCGIEC